MLRGGQPARVGERAVEPRERFLATEDTEGDVDRRRHRAARDGHAHGLRHATESDALLRRHAVDRLVDRGRGPVGHRGEPLPYGREQWRGVRGEVLPRRPLFVGRDVVEEEQAVLSHLLQRPRAFLLGLRDGREPLVRETVRRHAERLELRAEVPCEVRGAGAHDVLLVGPEHLVRVERRRRLVAVLDVEQAHQLLETEDLLVAVRPAEAREVVEQRLRQEAHVAVLQHADRAVALGELRAVGAEDHRQVGVRRRLDAERAQHLHLPRRVVDVVVAADHVRDSHVVVVHDHAEIVGGRAVRARDDQVVELARLEHDRSVHDVLNDHLPLVGAAKAHHRIHARPRVRARPAAAVVARLLLARELRRAPLLELLLAAVAVVGVAVGQELRDDLAVPVHPPGLVEHALVVVEPEPLHALEDRLHGLGRGALEVGVLYAQDEHAAAAARVQPAEQRRAHAADVQHASGARGESGADGHGAGACDGRERARILAGPVRGTAASGKRTPAARPASCSGGR